MTWPLTRIRTYKPGMPVASDDLNEFQDTAIQTKHGYLTTPHPVDRRILVSGTWAVDAGGAPGAIVESGAGLCFVMLHSPPIGSVITGAAMKVKDGGASATLQCILWARSFAENGASQVGNGVSPGSGAITVSDLSVNPYTLAQGERLYAEISTVGGAGGARNLYELYLTYYRP